MTKGGKKNVTVWSKQVTWPRQGIPQADLGKATQKATTSWKTTHQATTSRKTKQKATTTSRRLRDEPESSPSTTPTSSPIMSSSSSSGTDSDSQFRELPEDVPRPDKIERFVVPEARATYNKFTKKRPILEERQFYMTGTVDAYARIQSNLERRGWLVFCVPPGNYIPSLVREFYANAKCKRFKEHWQTIVRGKEVRYEWEQLNAALGIDRNPNTVDYIVKLSVGEEVRPWVASIIATPGTTPEWVHPGFNIWKKDLNFEAKAWLAFVSSRLIPSMNETKIPLRKAVLIAALMSGMELNPGTIIMNEIKNRIEQNATSLPFPCLLTCLITSCDVPRIPHLDTVIEATGRTEVDRIQDEGNPKDTKKRKRSTEEVSLETLISDPAPTLGESSEAAMQDPSSSTAAPAASPRLPITRLPSSVLGQTSLLQIPGVVAATSTVVHSMNEKLNTILQDPLLTLSAFRDAMRSFQEGQTQILENQARMQDTLRELVEGQKKQTKELQKMGKRVKSIEQRVEEDTPRLRRELSTLSRDFYRYCRGDASFLDEVEERERRSAAADVDDEAIAEEEDPEREELVVRRAVEIYKSQVAATSQTETPELAPPNSFFLVRSAKY